MEGILKECHVVSVESKSFDFSLSAVVQPQTRANKSFNVTAHEIPPADDKKTHEHTCRCNRVIGRKEREGGREGERKGGREERRE